MSRISRSHRQGSAGTGVKDQPEPCQSSGDAGTSSITRNTTSPSAPGGSRTPNLLIRSQMLYPLSYRRRQPMLPRRRSAQERRRRANSWRSRTTTLASTSSDEPPGRRLAPPSAIRSRRSLSWRRPSVARVALRWIVVMMSSCSSSLLPMVGRWWRPAQGSRVVKFPARFPTGSARDD